MAKPPPLGKSPRPEDAGRPVGEIVIVLGKDFGYLADKMLASAKRGTLTAKDATHARNLVMTLFALAEGASHALKINAMWHHLDRASSGPAGAGAIVFEERYELDDKGEIVARPLKLTLERNLKFAFRFYADTFGIANTLRTDATWWHAFKRCEKLRDKLMHPRDPEDLEVSPDDIISAVQAERGLREAVLALVRAPRAR